MKENTTKRAGFLDEVRGFAILCMVVYHGAFALEQFYKVKVPILFDDWFYYVWAVFAGSFIFISGIVCRYSRNNIKRGSLCFFLGMMVTFVTAVTAPEVAILFGILHFLGVCMMLYGLGEKIWDKIKPKFAVPALLLICLLTWQVSDGYFGLGRFSVELPRMLYDARLLFPLGFTPNGFASGDFFPLFPWVFLFFAGAYFGVYVKDEKCPKFFYTTRVPLLAAAGRHTIWIYLLHQPIIMGVLYLIYG